MATSRRTSFMANESAMPDIMRQHPITLLFAMALASGATEILPSIHGEYNTTREAQLPLEDGWRNPPRIAKTRVWWWWLNGNTDAPTITRDLEAMKAAGIGGANVIDAGGDNQEGNRRVPHGPDFGSPEWITLFRHAMAEADRLGLEMGFNIQSGWNLGGPSVPPEDSSKRITFSRTIVPGGAPVDLPLPRPESRGGYYADVAVLAVPVAQAANRVSVRAMSSSAQEEFAAVLAADGNPDTFWVSRGTKPGDGPSTESPEWIELEFAEPVTADHIEIHPRNGYGPTAGHIVAMNGNQSSPVAGFTADGKGVIRVNFPKTCMRRLRISITKASDPRAADARNVQIREIVLSHGGNQILGPVPSSREAKALAQKAYFRYPGEFAATKAWHLLDPGPEHPGEPVLSPGQILDLTEHMDAGGRLRWTAPRGQWEILRFGSTLTGSHVSTNSENAGGYAIDYLDRATLDAYWKKTLDPILDAVKPHLGRSLRFLHTDSWELGAVNWTRRMPEEFLRLRGYDLKPWLPVLAGKIIGSREKTDLFLNDFRRTLADLMAENKYEGFRENAHARGLGIHPESGGPHAGPMDALRNLGISDMPMGEFWSTSPRHRVRDDQRFFVKQTTSAAHIYGRRVSLAEAFTNIGRHWQHDPRSLKPTFDRAACEGHNLTMWHTFSSSAAVHGIPGAAYFAGEHLNPNVTWWNQSHAFIGYMNRCHFILQQGVPTSDVLHFYGENVPSFVRLKRDDPAQCLPGHDYDVIDAHALLHRVTAAEDGCLSLPEGTRYRVLSLTPHNAVGLTALRKIASLVDQGVTLVGPRPGRPFSLTGGRQAEDEFRKLVRKLWDDGPRGEKRVGMGRVVWGITTREFLEADGIARDFSWLSGDENTAIDFIHRSTDEAQIYFVSNRKNRPENLTLRFRVTGMHPEIWDPVTGLCRDASRFRFDRGVTEVPMELDPEQSLFFIFRRACRADQPQGTPNQPSLNQIAVIDGPWDVSFDSQWGGPASIRFDRLIDWTSHPSEGIRHYSGTAVYHKTFQRPATKDPVFLELGMVESLCEVNLNGKDLGVWWSYPFRRDISAALQPGENFLEVKVVNLWCNRIIGDAALPASERRTRTNITRLTKNTPLEPSGLLGPVRLLVGH